jgi:hypothetical protein
MKTRELKMRNGGWKVQSVRGLAQSKTWRVFVAALALSACALMSASAQSYTMSWYKIAGGGETSTNGQYSLSGTIGQPDASLAMTGGNYALTGGFWALISVVQTPGAPTLYINISGNTVTVYWQNVSGYVLQQSPSIAPPVSWTQNNSWSSNSNGTNYLTITPATGNLFFRLAP